MLNSPKGLQSTTTGLWQNLVTYDERTTVQYVIGLAAACGLDMWVIDVATYLYGNLDSDIYMRIPYGFKKHVHVDIYMMAEVKSQSIKF